MVGCGIAAGHPPAGRLFQTKSFDRCLDRYIVTAQGRLCRVGNGWQDDGPFDGRHGQQDGIDVDFHGDMRLTSMDGKQEQYVARFTHGTLEWIRPMADVLQVGQRRMPTKPPTE